MRDKSKLFPQFLFRSLRESHLPFSKNDYDSNRPHTSLDEAHPDGGRKPPDEAMTILELLSLQLSVDGLVKAIACDQRTIAKRLKDIGRHRGKAAMNVRRG
jgi:hypothetical protein